MRELTLTFYSNPLMVELRCGCLRKDQAPKWNLTSSFPLRRIQCMHCCQVFIQFQGRYYHFEGEECKTSVDHQVSVHKSRLQKPKEKE